MNIKKGQPFVQFEIGDCKNFVYFILDWEQKEAAIIDPHSPLSTQFIFLQQNEFKLSKVFLTHTHWDHVLGLPEVIRFNPEVKIFLHQKEAHRLDNKLKHLFHFVKDMDEFRVGNIVVKVLHTPGHSAGECCFFVDGNPPCFFTGDTVFIRDCGRTDLSTGSVEDMFNSLQKIKTLPGNTVIFPGHHYYQAHSGHNFYASSEQCIYAPSGQYQNECSSVLSVELKESRPFLCKSVKELEQLS